MFISFKYGGAFKFIGSQTIRSPNKVSKIIHVRKMLGSNIISMGNSGS
jgi:hypothetical protein